MRWSRRRYRDHRVIALKESLSSSDDPTTRDVLSIAEFAKIVDSLDQRASRYPIYVTPNEWIQLRKQAPYTLDRDLPTAVTLFGRSIVLATRSDPKLRRQREEHTTNKRGK